MQCTTINSFGFYMVGVMVSIAIIYFIAAIFMFIQIKRRKKIEFSEKIKVQVYTALPFAFFWPVIVVFGSAAFCFLVVICSAIGIYEYAQNKVKEYNNKTTYLYAKSETREKILSGKYVTDNELNNFIDNG